MNTPVEPIAQIPGYQISEQLYTSFRSRVYRAIREIDQLPVIIKVLQQEYLNFSELLHFRNQYTIAKNLDLPSIVRPYSLEPYRNSYALVMEDFGGISLKEWMKRGIGSNPNFLAEFLDIAIALSNILDGLYRHRIIHKDIKPANILINPETKQVKLIDFSIASLLPRETPKIHSPNVLEGTLAYLSPEQTGRMNRGIDYRSDYYSLGVTFFELLTGELPFQSNDPMELVHCHIAKLPPLLAERRKGVEEIPQVLGEIVMKLMAKNAEDRYQSALGLKFDLEKCLNQLQEIGSIKSFKLGERDICDRFIIPEKLYGRQIEVESLLDAFEEVSQGSTEIILVAGFSGIGKTAVVNEVHKPIVRQRGYFIKGKFDQFHNIPFSAFVQAFRDLIGQLLSETNAQFEQWKCKILSALGENGQVMIEVIPELESMIGKQLPAPELSGSAAENRFNLLFLKLTQVLTTREHPLVIFIDDLQWADSASLKLIHLLMSEADIGYLLLIGAYRDNEVNPVHLLMLTLEEIQRLGATVNTITLAPLNHVSINHLVADTLSCSLTLAAPLTELVFSKTKGNPFFSTQFLKALHQDKLITFNFDGGYWECDIAQVRSLSLTDDVVEFMVIQLQKLPTETQEVLKLAACVGNQFDLATLAIVYEKSQMETVADFWKAVQDGLIIPTNEVYKFYHQESDETPIVDQTNTSAQLSSYRFLHDRVQQAAYSLIPKSQRKATHLKTNFPLDQQSFQVSQETGNLIFGVWAVSFLIWSMLIKGDRLSDVYAQTEKYLSYVQQVNDANMLYVFTLQRQFLLNLQDISKNTDLLDDRNGEDIPYIEVWRQKKNFEHGINWYCFLKIQLSYLYGRYADAVKAAEEVEKTLASNCGAFPIIQYYFYYPLSLIALYPNATLEKKKEYWEMIREHQQIQKTWANNCPENFLHRYLLLSAEMAKISDKYMDAIELYDRAIAKAKENEYLNEEALANELAAKFYLEWGKERIAQEYLINAYYCYTRWGAKAKVDDLEQRYPQLLAPILQQTQSPLMPNETITNIDSIVTLHPSFNKSVSSSSSASVMLDLAKVLKAFQTLSSEIELDKLLTKLLQVVIENAGADKCALILLKGGRLVVEATAEVGQQSTVLQSIFVEDSADIPHSLIYTVKRRLQPYVILDTTVYPALMSDPYIIRQQPKSLLCTPILYQGKLLGILYLENNFSTAAFTSDRVEILNLLCTQAAISLENARLYQQAQDTLKTLGQTEQFLRLIIDNIPQSVFWKDRNSVYLGCNQKFAQTSGLEVPENVIGKTDYDLSWTREESDFYVECDRHIMESGQAELNIIETLQQADGKQIWSNINKIPLKDREGNVFGILGTCEDITEHHQAQQLLQQRKQELEQALEELQTMQLQLVQSEKMSALGNLVAGVAHEINNPVGFIAGNLEPAKDYINDLFGLIKLYQDKFPEPGSDIEDEIDAMDLNYLREDLPKLLDSMKLGVNRIRSISTSLRTFSRADKDYKVPFNIHEGIDSTILILRHRLKASEKCPAINVVKDYGKLPLVECFAGQLNQVFMNLLANAIDALEEYNTKRSLSSILANPNCITIQTRLAESGQHILIKIADNGVGMSPEVKQRVFDHLFTTKAVGKGTGLGLAIARQIVVEGHGGSLSCTSELGQGTEFVIQISTQQK
ncbi:MAG: AAA family ATPase [Nostoc sp.]|uniref:trifunctional serine/threonine-protein kinase/ATP-binding protein/sensor histidine kinase n=1 Tax=Nostoc sp. TaxID=1180 RepID=UPI002FF82723